MGENKRYKKSETYKGVYQRKDGSWFYRYKRIFEDGSKPVYYQKGGFLTDKIAYEARMTDIRLSQAVSKSERQEHTMKTFGEFFADFLKNGTDSESSILKYKRLYNAHLKMWEDRNIHTISDADIENLLLSLSICGERDITKTDAGTRENKFQGYSESYQGSFRRCLKFFYKYLHKKYGVVLGDMAQNIDTKPQKLKVLSLFSGIGAPERALKNIGIDFELVNFCEFDDNAAFAYHLLHNVSLDKDLTDVENLDEYYCKQALPDFDIMVFGSPCQDFSRNGKQKGLFRDHNKQTFTTQELFDNLYEDFYYSEDEAIAKNANKGPKEKDVKKGESKLTRSGLIYRAIQVAIYKRPKFILVENVGALLSATFEKEFNAIVRNLQDIGYNIFFEKMNSLDYGVPQNRPRVFLIAIRDDIAVNFEFPEPIPLKAKASDWFEKDVADEYYLDPEDYKKLERDSYPPFFSTDYIHCITTKWGKTTAKGKPDPDQQQQWVKDEKGIRCLTSEELMRFQGFRPEDAKILWENGYSRGDIGKLVGNSITVNVMEAIFRQFVFALRKSLETDIVPNKIIKAKIEKKYTESLFSYPGNKYKLLPFLDYLLPPNMESLNFYDLFAGGATVAINVKADRVIINEKNDFLYYIYKGLSEMPPEQAWELVKGVAEKYDLPSDCTACPYYKLKDPEGTPKEKQYCYSCKQKYKACINDYNAIPYEDRISKYWYWSVALVYHSFNNCHINHTKSGKYSAQLGSKKCVMAKFKKRFFPFAEFMYSKRTDDNLELHCGSYKDFANITIYADDAPHFFYLDPPYYKTSTTYTIDWKEPQERALYEFLDKCTDRGIYWMLSNVTDNNGTPNDILKKWLKDNQGKYYVYFMQRDYTNCTYNRKNKGVTHEVAVTNYRASCDTPYDEPIPITMNMYYKPPIVPED